jgi:hypothetical protein
MARNTAPCTLCASPVASIKTQRRGSAAAIF